MFMPKKPVSVTLDESNLVWLKGPASRKKRSLSDALDEILTQARQGGRGGDAPRSVVGTVDLATDDPDLEQADAAIRALLSESLSRPTLARERPSRYAPARPASSTRSKRG
jgi:hypothetical protein